MAVHSVRLSADVFWVCLNHAFSTEKEEVMGLLIGEVDEKNVSHVSAVIMLRRSDKRKDRVEISPEQLSDASLRAENLASQLGRPMRVLGWYHSHPRITVWPSHVDVRTQATYQMMDQGFIGLIFSVFNEEKTSKLGKIQVTCFQSISQNVEGDPSNYVEQQVPVHVVPTSKVSQICMESLVDLPSVLYLEETEAFNNVAKIPGLDIVARLHNSSVCTSSLCHITEIASIPLLQTLDTKIKNNLTKIEKLKEEIELLNRTT